MKHKTTLLILPIVFAAILCCGKAFGQVKPDTVSVTPYIGGMVFDKEHLLTNAPVYGVRVGYDFTPHFGVEASANAFFSKYDRSLPDVDQGSNGLHYRMEVIAHLLPQHRLTPFLAAGAGGQTINYPRGVQNTTAATADYGGGLKYFLSDCLALRADIRHTYVFDNAKKDIEYGMGLSFLFGGSKRALTPQEAPLLHAPSELSAKALSDSQNHLSWKTVAGAASYRVYREGNYLTSAANPSLADTRLSANTQYCYKVSAVDGAGKESERSSPACAKTLPLTSPPLPPTEAISAVAVSGSQNNVTWKEVAGAASYKIYRDGLYLTASKTPSLSDGGLKEDTQYCYAVSAVDAPGKEWELSKQACATTLAPMLQQKEAAEAASVQKEMLERGRATIDIEFDYNKAVVKPMYHPEIKKFADVMQAHPALRVVIEGHTDNVGSQGYNMKLSLKRAESVRKYMIDRFRIKGSRLISKGYGMSKPIAGNETAEGRKKNRRVEAAVVYSIKK